MNEIDIIIKKTIKSVLFRIITIIAILEFSIMMLFMLLDGYFSPILETFIDTLLLSFLSAPLLYKFVIHPFVLKELSSRKKLQKSNEIFSDNVIASNADTAGVITYASKALCRISGYSQEELEGSPHSILRHSDTPPNIFKDMWQTIQSGKEWSGDIKNRTKDGGFYWVHTVIFPEINKENKILGYKSIRQEITSEKAKEELQERLELTLLANNDGVWDWNLNTNEVYFSPRWKEMIGYSKDELPNELSTWKERVHPDDLDAILKKVQNNIDGKTNHYESTHRIKHKNGSWVWIHDRGKTLFENGIATRMIGTHTDITKHKTEELLHVQRGKILENSLNEIYIINAQTYKFIYINTSAEENIGYTYEDMKSMTPIDINIMITQEQFTEIINPLTQDKKQNTS